MMKHLPPKPTTYANVKFRSRLEAKWAVLLDNCSNVLNWEYEAVTLRLPDGAEYTPDFKVKLFVEVTAGDCREGLPQTVQNCIFPAPAAPPPARPSISIPLNKVLFIETLLEVKPSKPSIDYLDMVRNFSALEDQFCKGTPLAITPLAIIVVWGAIHTSNNKLYTVAFSGKKSYSLQFHKLLPDLDTAFAKACHYRFDLA